MAKVETPSTEVKVEVEAKVDTVAPTETQQKIIKQIEFYFSDSKLPTDKFLQGKIKENSDRWVAVSVLLTFNRLKTLVKDEQDDAAKIKAVVEAMKVSSNDLVEVNETNDHVRRTRPLPENTKCDHRCIYAKGFPTDETGNPGLLDEIDTFFTKQIEGGEGKVNFVNMRRIPKDRTFKGSVFIEFSKEEDAKKVAEQKIKFRESDEDNLLMYMKADYIKMKGDQRKAKRSAKKEADKEAKKKDDEEKKKKAEEEKAAEQQKLVDSINIDMVKSAVLRFSNVAEGTSREDIKDVFVEYAPIGWIDFERGATEGKMRFTEENGATTAKAKYEEAKTEIEGNVLTLSVLEGDEEQKYWDAALEAKKAQALEKMKNNQRNKRHGRGGYRGGRGGYRGGRGGYKRSRDGDNHNNSKRQRTD